MRQGLKLIKETLGYGLRSIAKARVSAGLMILISVGSAVLASAFSHSVLFVVYLLVPAIEFAVVGFAFLEVRRNNPTGTQEQGKGTPGTEFWSLSWPVTKAAFLLYLAYVLVLVGIFTLEVPIASRLATSGTFNWYLVMIPMIVIIALATAFLLAPAMVGYAGMMLEGSRKCLRAFRGGYRLSWHKLWYPVSILAILQFLMWALSSIIANLSRMSSMVAFVGSLLLLLLWAVILVWIAASFNRVYYELTSAPHHTVAGN